MKKFDIVILAAGFSSRMGESKMEIVLKGKTVLEHTISQAYDLSENIFVVTGHFHNSMERLLSHYKKVNLVYNANYEAGMFSSVKIGIQKVKLENFFLIPGDIPFVKKETYRKLSERTGKIIIPSFSGRKGHPVLMSSELIPKILNEDNNSNLRNFIRRQKTTIIEVKDKFILKDLNYPKDLKGL
jgi:molybdenum cofactor cytidylyltransferase